MEGSLIDKVALVTGGAAGIGRVTAQHLAAEGATVVVADVDRRTGAEVVAELRAGGHEGLFVSADVTDASSVEDLVKAIVAEFGRLDCAFNNAGVEGGELVPFPVFEESNWDRVIDVNLKGVWLCMRYEMRQMQRQGGGSIVNAASILGVVASPNNPAYTASKHGVVGLTKSGALAGAEHGIRVNAVAPGYMRTEMVDRILEPGSEQMAEVIARHPLGRLGLPDEVARAVVWLCSDESSFVTGDTLLIDGGYVAR